MLLMPLRSDFGEINRVLGCTSGDGEVHAPPLAFTIEDVTVTPIETSQSAEVRRALPGFAEEQASFGPGPGTPKLHSIDGNPNAPTKSRQGGPKLRVIDK